MDSCSVYERPFDELPPPPPTFRQAPPPLLFRYITENSFLYGDQLRKYRGEQKSWADFLFRSFVNRQKKDNKSAFESEQKHYVSLENYFSKKLSDMTRVSVSVSNFVNMPTVNPLDFSVPFKHTVLPFFASFGRSLRELLPQE